MENLLETAAANQRRAREIIRTTGLEAIWRSVGAEPRLVGSLRTGLLMTHRDIDFHIYSAPLRTADSFAAMARLAEDRHIRRVEFANLLDAEDRCLEWHAQYVDDEGAAWQIDMIHMEHGSPWDGYFERVADRIAAVLTDETRLTILRLKYETPLAEKIPGIRYCEAVLRDGVRTREEFAAWLAAHPAEGIVTWMPRRTARAARFFCIGLTSFQPRPRHIIGSASRNKPLKRETCNMEHPNTPLPDRIARAVADYHAELYRFAALRTGSQSDAEDIVQEAFLRLLTAPGEITHLRAYLYRCVANACCDRKRRQAVFEPLGPQLPADDGEAPLREEAERIAALLDRLPKEQAEVIRLHTFASLRFTEIAQTLQLPASTVKSRFHYGIERLKKLM